MLLAGSSLLTLLDDIATLLDDISVMGKLAAKKTAGVLGDDLSLNAQQVSGVRANRELPVAFYCKRVHVNNRVNAVILILKRPPVSYCSYVISERKAAGRLNSAEDNLFLCVVCIRHDKPPKKTKLFSKHFF